MKSVTSGWRRRGGHWSSLRVARRRDGRFGQKMGEERGRFRHREQHRERHKGVCGGDNEQAVLGHGTCEEVDER